MQCGPCERECPLWSGLKVSSQGKGYRFSYLIRSNYCAITLHFSSTSSCRPHRAALWYRQVSTLILILQVRLEWKLTVTNPSPCPSLVLRGSGQSWSLGPTLNSQCSALGSQELSASLARPSAGSKQFIKTHAGAVSICGGSWRGK